jgi:ADP-dependent NAD(P)H-hydrate dehydratase
MPAHPRRKPATGDWQGVETLSPRLLRGWQLPQPSESGDKESRGRVLVVAGSAELPGTAILASTAALRAGAGKLRIAAVESIAPSIGVAVPEARIYALPETEHSGIDPTAAEYLAELANDCQATLIGPGLVDNEAILKLLIGLLPRLSTTSLVLDSEAMMAITGCPDELYDLRCPAALTPHAGEMAGLLGDPKEDVLSDLVGSARRASARFRTVIVLKSAESIIADPEGRIWRNRGGTVGLATSGSGDTLSGIIAGLAARGADLPQAAAWGVFLHSRAGERLASRIGPLGFLARELLAEIPPLMRELAQPSTASRSGGESSKRRGRRG